MAKHKKTERNKELDRRRRRREKSREVAAQRSSAPASSRQSGRKRPGTSTASYWNNHVG